MYIPTTGSVEERFLAPLFSAIQTRRECGTLCDSDFLLAGVLRVASQCISGRDFLQHCRGYHEMRIPSSTYFDALNSNRRLEMVRQTEGNLADLAVAQLRRTGDRLAEIDEVAGREVWAGDGHSIEHACHDARTLHSDDTMRYTAVNTVYI